MKKEQITIDANEAVARVAYLLNEVIAIYPITPSSPMGEWADQWASESRPNLWGSVPRVIEMQSEGGAAGALHGALQTGALATTFTASQGLLLMIPNMYKIAGELTPMVMHVAARSLAAQALSIFGDHSDVMAARATGFAMLASNSVQEAQDFALIAQAASLESRISFLHFFDGFRTSHEVAKISALSDDDIRAMIDDELVRAHRARALSPDNPFIRGTAQNPDVYFQAREAVNAFYLALPTIVQNAMDKFAALTGRQYHLYDYVGADDAERVVVLMGSGAETAEETVAALNVRGEKVGVLKVRLFHPFCAEQFLAALPSSVKQIAVLDRTKEPGSLGEPLYLNVVAALQEFQTRAGATALTSRPSNVVRGSPDPAHSADRRSPESESGDLSVNSTARSGDLRRTEGRATAEPLRERTSDSGTLQPSSFIPHPSIIGGRYGLSSKEFTPAMVKGIFDELRKPQPKNHFTIGITDDVTHTSLEYDPNFSTEDPRTVRAIFYGLGSDGTVGANKNSIKIIGEETDFFAQGYFVYDSKKSGSMTISHLRFGPTPIRSTYLITRANFVACHQSQFLRHLDVLKFAEPNATFLLNTTAPPDEAWARLPRTAQRQVIEKNLRFFVIDGYKVARESGMGGRVNTIMQTCFFALSGVLPRDEAIAAIKKSIEKTYGKRGASVVKKNFAAVDAALAHLHEVSVPSEITSDYDIAAPVPATAPEFVQKVSARMIANDGDSLPVSAMPVDGTYPSSTTQWEKRNIALEIPVWDEALCIQCGKCVLVCPHSVIRGKIYSPELLKDAPPTFKSAEPRWREYKELRYTLQVAPEDCTGCALCVEVCPAKSKSEVKHKAINMMPQPPLLAGERANWDFFLRLPEAPRDPLNFSLAKDVQLLQPLFEFSGACAGCGETPYLKLLSQLFGDRTVIANATGCSSIYGGNQPTTPWTVNHEGRGPAWSNSLFEDNAEFGLGMRLALDKQAEYARELLKKLAPQIGDELVKAVLEADQSSESGINAQRERVKVLKEKLNHLRSRDGSDVVRPIATALTSTRAANESEPRNGGHDVRAVAPARDFERMNKDLISVADSLVKKSVWIVGGDGWAYDIGYGGLDHVLASGQRSTCSCSTPKFIPTRADRCRRRRRAARWRNLRRAANRVRKKTSQ
jgi:pyruvate-ferredoxin/flavodoxin oxidoreductase